MTPRLARVLLLASALAGVPGATQDLPPGFVRERIGGAFQDAIALAWIDEHRLLVAERQGLVWYVVDDVRRNLVLDLTALTNSNHNRGLFGLAASPSFDADGWIYLLHTLRIPGELATAPSYSRLVRVRTEVDSTGQLVAQPGTLQPLVGETWATGIASCTTDHTLGSLRFLSDGSLVLAAGDNSVMNVDTGGQNPDCFLPGRTPLDQDLGSFRSQSLDSLCGKVLRVDPETGLGLPDNPFFSGNAADLRSRVWARGLRNPFRLTLVPGSGPREALLVADVGWNDWEEIDLCIGGENFGWPCYEGQGAAPSFPGLDTRGFCASAVHAPPLLAWNHTEAGASGFTGNCASGLAIYQGQRYPEVYRGRLFFFDFERSWLRAAELGADLRIRNVLLFGRQMGSPVELVTQPGTGDLVYIGHGTRAASVFRLRYVGEQHPPVAAANASPSFGPGDLEVTLSAAGSSDPDGQALVYSWDLGDGTSASAPMLVHHYPAGRAYVARLTVTDAEGLAASAEVRITPGETPPSIQALTAPRDGDLYLAGEPLRCLASAVDAEDGVPRTALWSLDLVHDHHVHPDVESASGAGVLLHPAAHDGGDIHYVVRLRVTDSAGLSDERSLEVFDSRSLPRAHLAELATSSVRVGEPLSPHGHVDYSLGRVTPKQAALRWDWGDGTGDLVPEARHQVDSTPTHVYQRPGTYVLKLSALLGEHVAHVHQAEIRVAPPWPAVAIFAPLDVDGWIPVAEQEAIVAALELGLGPATAGVADFHVGEGAALAAWLERYRSDSIPDMLVLLDALPAALVANGIPGSLLQRWVEGGNGIVWSGRTPFQTLLGDDGTRAQTQLGADQFFDATAPYLVLGEGLQRPTPRAAAVVPSLGTFLSARALRHAQLGASWRVRQHFAGDTNGSSDALELEHLTKRGTYAQFLCTSEAGLPRAAVLREYLSYRIRLARLAGPGAARR